ncbi:MAG: TA system VapC family ribonuclease toxin [Bryobacteraceae bacterium]|jgi:toxin-antitoxin system PIN domain toxin
MRTAPRKPGLLDVNVLIALIDPAHEFHALAHLWFQHNRQYGWATCPITENGCLRILSKPGYPFPGLTAARVRDILAEMAGAEGHRFWPDSVSILEANRFDFAGAGPKTLTDLYLLRLAAASEGRLITFDRTIRWQWVTGCGPDDLEILAGKPEKRTP